MGQAMVDTCSEDFLPPVVTPTEAPGCGETPTCVVGTEMEFLAIPDLINNDKNLVQHQHVLLPALSDQMLDTCQAACTANGFKFSGVTLGQDCGMRCPLECWCDNEILLRHCRPVRVQLRHTILGSLELSHRV